MSFKHILRRSARNGLLNIVGSVRRPAPGIHILGGHKISQESGSGRDVDIEKFDKLLNRLSKYCRLVRFEEALQMIRDKETPSEPIVAFTFDDGFEDCYFGIAPILEKYGVNGMFFINPNAATAADMDDVKYIENFVFKSTDSPGKRPMKWDQIRDLVSRGHKIGAHTLDHYMINQNDESELIRQIKDCRSAIESKIGVDCDSFAWPYGQMSHVNHKALEIACEAYKNVFSQTDYKKYYSCDGHVINRRHFEPFWNWRHVFFFLSFKKSY